MIVDAFQHAVAELRLELDAFAAQWTARLAGLREHFQEIERVLVPVQDAWSYSWVGYQATLYYRDFQKPPVSEQYDQAWGGTPAGWRERSYSDITAYVSERYSGPVLADIAAQLNEVYQQALSLDSKIQIVLSPLRELPAMTREIELLEQLERHEWGKSAETVIAEWRPGTLASADRIAIHQGWYTPPHLQYFANLRSGLTFISGINTFVSEAGRLVSQVHTRLLFSQLHREGTVESSAKRDPSKVFVIHGRNRAAYDAVYSFLHTLKLSVLTWEQAVALTGSTSATTLEIVTAGLWAAGAILVIFSPDEEVRLRQELIHPNDDDEHGFQPRPNVVLEAGMALAIAPDLTIITQVGRIRPISDVSGINYVPLGNEPVLRQQLIARLRTAGCSPDDRGEWFNPMVAGDFPPAEGRSR